MHICLFDIDGTLINTAGAGGAAMLAALESEFGLTRRVDGIPTIGRTDRAIAGDLFRFHELTDDDDTLGRFVQSYLRHLEAELPRKRGQVLPGILELLDLLVARDDIHVGLLTGNFREGAHRKLAHYGLADYFPFGSFGDTHLERDDVARAALEMLQQEHADLDLERVWVIGDTPADIQCGQAIGARTVAVATGWIEIEELAARQPDHLFESFAEPQRFVEMLL